MEYNVASGFGAVGDGERNDHPAIQNALDAARRKGGGTVFVPKGRFLIKNTLNIYSNIRLKLDDNAVIIRGDDFGNMLRPIETPVKGYNGEHDFAVEGGTWDFNGNKIHSAGTALTFAHARNVTLKDLRVINVYRNHCVEINSSYNVRVLNSVFDTQIGDRASEAIQIDGAFRETVYPAFGEYDYTMCKHVLIDGCTFLNWSRGIGSHTREDGYDHQDIKLTNNHFENIYDDGIRIYGYRGTVISGNTFDTCNTGILAEYCLDTIVSNNVIRNSRNNGINLYNEANGTVVSGNTVSHSANQGISLYNKANNNVISNNVVRYNGKYGIVVNSSGNNLVSSNVLVNNGKDGSYASIRLTNGAYANHVEGNRAYGPNPDFSDVSSKGNNEADTY